MSLLSYVSLLFLTLSLVDRLLSPRRWSWIYVWEWSPRGSQRRTQDPASSARLCRGILLLAVVPLSAVSSPHGMLQRAVFDPIIFAVICKWNVSCALLGRETRNGHGQTWIITQSGLLSVLRISAA